MKYRPPPGMIGRIGMIGQFSPRRRAVVVPPANDISAAIYDGIQGYLLHTGGPAGATDGTTGTFVWSGTLNSDGSAQTFYDIPGTVPVLLQRQSDNTIDFVVGTAGAVCSNSTAAVAASVGFCIILASFSGTTSHLYVIHATATVTGTNTPGSSASADLTADWFLGSDGGAADFLDADTALWWADDSFIDFSDSDNREEFWDTTNDLLRDPGATGANATGSQPLVCHKNPAATHTVNAGSGGDADTAGLFTDGTSPGTYAADFTPAADATVVLTDIDENMANSASYTFTGASIGTASADRLVAVVVHGGANLASPVSPAVTIGGNAATEVLTAIGSSGNLRAITSISILAVAAGTTADIVVTGNNLTRCIIEVYAITGIPSATASDTGSATNNIALSDTLTIPNGGVVIGGSTGFVVSSMTWANVAETATTDRVVEANTTVSAAAEVIATGGATALTATFADTPDYASAVFATWAPS